jgi:hypothetical protein
MEDLAQTKSKIEPTRYYEVANLLPRKSVSAWAAANSHFAIWEKSGNSKRREVNIDTT